MICMAKLGGGGDVELPAWSAWLSQDWSAGNHDHPVLDARNDGLAHDGGDPVEPIHNAEKYEGLFVAGSLITMIHSKN